MQIKYILTLFLFIGSTFIYGFETEGYIIDRQGNKTEGLIRLSSVNLVTGAVSINNINYVPLYISVFFKQKGTKRFKEYYADDIDGFSFFFDNQQIFFFSIELPVREWGQTKMYRKFLRLVVNGYLILFDFKSLMRFGNNYTEMTDYYISDSTNVVLNATDNEYATFEDYLVKGLKIDQEFLHNQPFKINLRNIKNIVINYNQWVKSATNN